MKNKKSYYVESWGYWTIVMAESPKDAAKIAKEDYGFEIKESRLATEEEIAYYRNFFKEVPK